jgi:NAD(P) transhydrogenase subunit alpha
VSRIAVLRETAPHERRVAATPDTVARFVKMGFEVVVEAGAGDSASVRDSAFTEAGATIASRTEAVRGANVILAVQAPDPATLAGADADAALIGMLNPYANPDVARSYGPAGLTAFSMEFMPRITRAQSMDVLSSQANLAGYKAVLDAAAEYDRILPMMMTAAGTVAAARVFVMGVGVAGLQAIATARRLGASVSATDIRAAVKEQIASLGAKPIFVENVAGQDDAAAGGYATEASPEYQAAQAALVSAHIAKQDIVITTALIPGRPAPRLISDAQIATMRPGSVIVDLAVEQGGNVEGSVAGEIVEKHGVKIVGHRNVPSRVAADTSALYARNLHTFINSFFDSKAKILAWPAEDEIIKAVTLTRGGNILHPSLTG